MNNTYLHTNYTPAEYYKHNSLHYTNPHHIAIKDILNKTKKYLVGTVLDLGCGPGLVSKTLSEYTCIGSDSEPQMRALYNGEFYLRSFWDEQPKCNSAVASYCLHLCPESRMHQVWWQLFVAGAITTVIITPFKNSPGRPSMFRNIDNVSSSVPGKNKTIYGRVYSL